MPRRAAVLPHRFPVVDSTSSASRDEKSECSERRFSQSRAPLAQRRSRSSPWAGEPESRPRVARGRAGRTRALVRVPADGARGCQGQSPPTPMPSPSSSPSARRCTPGERATHTATDAWSVCGLCPSIKPYRPPAARAEAACDVVVSGAMTAPNRGLVRGHRGRCSPRRNTNPHSPQYRRAMASPRLGSKLNR